MGEVIMKLRRSMLFVPGNNAAMLSTTFIFKPDSVMFDLEDAVALSEKDFRAIDGLPSPATSGLSRHRKGRADQRAGIRISGRRICRRRLGAVLRSYVCPRLKTPTRFINLRRELNKSKRPAGGLSAIPS